MNQTHSDTQTHVTLGGRCGCSEYQGECCKLECLLRPNFYGGQLLTDRDLKSLVDWVEGKSALQRFREGWGVACGLEVTCSHKSKEEARVYVAKGYAVDCCGRDVVLCEPAWYDFKCEVPNDPCCRERKPDRPYGGTEQPGYEAPAVASPLGCIPLSELRAFDLCLRFDEQMTGGQRALVSGSCAPMGECQFTRIREKGTLIAKEIKDPCAIPTTLPDETYRRKLKDLLDQLARHRSSPQSMLDYIRGKLHSFCFVEDCLCNLIRDEKWGDTWYVDWVFYILQDFRNHYFQCFCDACKHNPCEGDGVPLARVWIWDKKEDDCRICKVVYIDSYPPYRRSLGGDCWPSYPGHVNLSQYIWHEKVEVRQELARSGFTTIDGGKIDPHTVSAWESSEKDLIFAPYGSQLVIKWYPDLCGRERVVAFEKGEPR